MEHAVMRVEREDMRGEHEATPVEQRADTAAAHAAGTAAAAMPAALAVVAVMPADSAAAATVAAAGDTGRSRS